jgi:hypothetical protein
VIGAIDGDTLDILTASFETLRVRLSGIDAPELGQAFGRNAKAALSSLVFAPSVAIEWRDRYYHLVATVTLERRDLGVDVRHRACHASCRRRSRRYGSPRQVRWTISNEAVCRNTGGTQTHPSD